MPTLKVATPQVSVTLIKTVLRDTIAGDAPVSSRFDQSAGGGYFDLTPFLGEGSSVRTSKSVRDPAGGFSISFSDKPHTTVATKDVFYGSGQESLYGLIEPMDMIEIRMWGGLGMKPGILPIVMRGFVSSVQRSQSMGSNGKPQRTVSVNGQDFGKIWQIYRVMFLEAYRDKSLLTQFKWTELFGVAGVNIMAAPQFVKQVIDKVLNPFLDTMLPLVWTTSQRQLQYDAHSIAVTHGVVGPRFQNAEGSLWDILREHGDVGPWNELFMDDREDGVYVTYRPNPYLHVVRPSGGTDLIADDAKNPDFVDVPDDYILSMDASRSDSDVANFYWVDSPPDQLDGEAQRRLASLNASDPSVTTESYLNSHSKYYGLRPMQVTSAQGDDVTTNMGGGLREPEYSKRNDEYQNWLKKRRTLLVLANRDNVVLESGTLRMKGGLMRRGGGGMLRSGDYLNIVQGSSQWLAYAVNVSHEFLPFQGFTTTVQFDRGTGFVDRVQANGRASSPWMTEQATRTGQFPVPQFYGR